MTLLNRSVLVAASSCVWRCPGAIVPSRQGTEEMVVTIRACCWGTPNKKANKSMRMNWNPTWVTPRFVSSNQLPFEIVHRTVGFLCARKMNILVTVHVAFGYQSNIYKVMRMRSGREERLPHKSTAGGYDNLQPAHRLSRPLSHSLQESTHCGDAPSHHQPHIRSNLQVYLEISRKLWQI